MKRVFARRVAAAAFVGCAAVGAISTAPATAAPSGATQLSTHPHADITYDDSIDEICVEVHHDLHFRVYEQGKKRIDFESELLHPGQTLCVQFFGLPEDTKMVFQVTGSNGSGAYAEVFDS